MKCARQQHTHNKRSREDKSQDINTIIEGPDWGKWIPRSKSLGGLDTIFRWIAVHGIISQTLYLSRTRGPHQVPSKRAVPALCPTLFIAFADLIFWSDSIPFRWLMAKSREGHFRNLPSERLLQSRHLDIDLPWLPIHFHSISHHSNLKRYSHLSSHSGFHIQKKPWKRHSTIRCFPKVAVAGTADTRGRRRSTEDPTPLHMARPIRRQQRLLIWFVFLLVRV